MDISFKSSALILIAVFCFGCKDILDQEPKTNLSPENFYTTISNFEAGVNGAYSAFRDAYTEGEFAYWKRDLWTDNMVPSAGNAALENVTAGELTPFSELPDSFWEQYYASINTINEILLAVRTSSLTQVADLKRMEGELLFLRAMLYTDLVMLFGDIPYLEEPPGFTESFQISRTPKAQVWQNIHRDLDLAIEVLPSTYGQEALGKVTRGAALTLQLRTWLYDTENTDHWNTALQYSRQLIDNAGVYGYALYDDCTADSYYNLFITDYNVEDIFSIQHAADLNNWGSFSNTKDVNSYIVSSSLMEAFETTDGRIITDVADTAYNYFNKEPRFSTSILHIGGLRTGTSLYHFVPANAVFAVTAKIKKGVDYALSDPKQDPHNQMLLRYSDALLMHAEALNETGGTAEAIETLKMIRDRAGLPTNLSEDYQTVKAAIQHERRVELCFEGTRYFDIIRWDIGQEVFKGKAMIFDRTAYGKVNSQTPREEYPYVKKEEHDYQFIQERNYLFPIPNSQRLNNETLNQNSGY